MKDYISEVSNLLKETTPLKLASASQIKNILDKSTVNSAGEILDDLDVAMRIRLKKILNLATPDQAKSLGINLWAAHACKHYKGTIKLYANHEQYYERGDLEDEIMDFCYDMYKNNLAIHLIDRKQLLSGLNRDTKELITQLTYSVTPFNGITQFLDILEQFTHLEHAMGVVIGIVGDREYLHCHDKPFPPGILMPEFKTPLVITTSNEEFRTDQIWRYRQMLHGAL